MNLQKAIVTSTWYPRHLCASSHNLAVLADDVARRIIDGAGVVELVAVALGNRAANDIHLVLLGSGRQLLGRRPGNRLGVLVKILGAVRRVEALLEKKREGEWLRRTESSNGVGSAKQGLNLRQDPIKG